MNALRFSALRKSFRGQELLNGLSGELTPGSITWVRGRNGSGKTTLFRILSGLLRPDSGSVELFGTALHSNAFSASSAQCLRQIGVVLHQSMLLGELTVNESLQVIAPLYENPRSVVELSDRLALTPFRDTRVRECSQGTVRRVAFAQALLGRPKVLILDEILSNLDQDGAEVVRLMIQEERGEGAIVLLSNHEELDRGMYDREIVLQ